MCLAHSVFAAKAFDALRGKRREGAAAAELAVRVVAVPTTLSGAEFTAIAGVTNVARNVKEGYAHPDLAPRAVVLDPRITVHTPAALWLSTGIRAVDHAVEDLCSINSQPLADAASLHALRLLSRGLRRTKTDPGDLDARLDSMIGAWLSLVGTQGGVEKGASHAIGHVLGGTAGVPHGFTSCVMLAHVLRWNKAVNAGRQKLVSEALGDANAEAADLVAQLVADLGLPRTLRDVKVPREQLRTIAEHTCMTRGPRPTHARSPGRRTSSRYWRWPGRRAFDKMSLISNESSLLRSLDAADPDTLDGCRASVSCVESNSCSSSSRFAARSAGYRSGDFTPEGQFRRRVPLHASQNAFCPLSGQSFVR